MKYTRVLLTAVMLMNPKGPAYPQETMESSLEKALPWVRAQRSDLSIRTSRWDTRLKLPVVESLLENPLHAPTVLDGWSESLLKTTRSADLLAVSRQLLDIHGKTPIIPPSARPTLFLQGGGFPAPARGAFQKLLAAIEQAQTLLNQSLHSLSPADRKKVLAGWKGILTYDEGEPDSSTLAASARFKMAPLLAAAHILTQAVDRALPALQQQAPVFARRGRRQHFRFGDVLVCGSTEDRLTAKELKGVALLVKTGPRTVYEGAVAAAEEGQIRLVIDWSEEVTVHAEDAPAAAGAGVFGIGLMYLPNEKGHKTILTGDFSQGAGFFGVGGLFLKGENARLEAHRFAQGAGTFGAGILSSSASRASQYKARFAAQGAGYTRGAGLFVHQGDHAQVEGGLYFPDPRESLALISFCQGAGYGPRAAAAGGVGLASLQGDHMTITSSYFSQGSGYWHSLGGFFVHGNNNTLQARRYDQGSGIHTALGGMIVRGDHNQTLNWSVGPAYGWDSGVGVFLGEGNDNSFQCESGSGHGEINGHGLLMIRGDRNRMALAHSGSGTWSRNAPSYGLALCEGRDNRFRLPELPVTLQGSLHVPANPWGILAGEGNLILDPMLKLTPVSWPSVEREQAKQKEKQKLQNRLQKVQDKPASERIPEWLSIAARFSLDNESPREAAQKLLSIDPRDLPVLIREVSSDSVDAFLQLRVLLSAFGPAAAPGLRQAFASAHGTRRVLLLSLLTFSHASDAINSLLKCLDDPDWRIRRGAAGALGYLWDRQQGRTSGRIPLLEAALDMARGSVPNTERLGEKYLTDFYPVLALDPSLKSEDRLALFQKNSGPYDAAGSATFAEFARQLHARETEYEKRISQELAETEHLRERVRQALLKKANDADPEVVQAVLLALGQMGDPKDATLIAGYIDKNPALVREAAAAALGKLGSGAKEALLQALGSHSFRLRSMALLAVAQTWDPELHALLVAGFYDTNESVRLTTVSSLSRLQAALGNERKIILKELKRLASQDPSPSVRATAACIQTQL